MRLLRAPLAVVVLAALTETVALAGCSAAAPADKVSTAPRSSAATRSFSPLNGPVEAAAQLPKSCDAILAYSDLQTAFGAPLPDDETYGNFAPLPNIGRTGRVTCGYGISVNFAGQQSAPMVTVSVSTYTNADAAASRAATTIAGDVSGGSSTRQVLVGDHPATILVEPGASVATTTAPVTPPPSSAPSSPGATGVTAVASPGATTAPAIASPSTTATAAAGGDTELVMSDGNRTFVLEIPVSALAGAAAVTALLTLTATVYQNTLPAK
jgi:hypothetical protein